jgi:DNA-binding NarL/FixJ family response regulator
MISATASTVGDVAVVATQPERQARLAEAAESLGCRVCARVASLVDLSTTSSALIVLLAVDDPRAVTADMVSEVRERLPHARLMIALPVQSKPDRRVAVLGADGIVYESELEQTFAPAIAALLCGLAVLPRELNASRHNPNFSSREKQVLALVVMGYTNIEIATKLFLAESTVKSHLSSSFRKLGVSSRKDAAARILDPDSGLGPGILAISGNGIQRLSAPERNGSAAA